MVTGALTAIDAVAPPALTGGSMVMSIEHRSGARMSELFLPDLVHQLTTPPELPVVHDEEDREVDFASGRTLAGAWPGARLVATHGLGHRRILRDPEVVSEVVRFVVPR